MSIRRPVLTAAGMGAVAAALSELTPVLPVLIESLAHPQGTVDRAGPEALVVAAAGVLAWLVWGWGALGLALTAASALPGLLGAAARIALGVVLPAGARRSTALLLGLGLGVTGPLLTVALPSAPAAAATVRAGAVPDWPTAEVQPAATPPDWPAPAPAGDTHRVVPGDCLWSIAEDRLLRRHGHAPTAAEVVTAVRGWWAANEAVIGANPDLIHPGQVLRPPP